MSKKRMVLYGLAAIVLLIGAAAAWMLGPALLPPERIDAGIAVGEQTPTDMELVDSTATPADLAGHMGENGMLLYFVRSVDWCPFCKAQMVNTEEIREAVEERGYSLVAISYDKPDIQAEFKAAEGLGHTLLSDTGSRMIDALDLRDPQYEAGSFAEGVPRASILVLAPDGTVRAKYVAADYRSRPSNEEVLAMLDGAGN